jgi:hypothetical protein
MENNKNGLYLQAKAFMAIWLVAWVIIYTIFAFVSWEWKTSNWFWSIRLIHVAVSTYIAYYYHKDLITIFLEDSDADNFFYDASKHYDD